MTKDHIVFSRKTCLKKKLVINSVPHKACTVFNLKHFFIYFFLISLWCQNAFTSLADFHFKCTFSVFFCRVTQNYFLVISSLASLELNLYWSRNILWNEWQLCFVCWWRFSGCEFILTFLTMWKQFIMISN